MPSTEISLKIYKKIQLLKKELNALEKKSSELKKADTNTKTDMHHIELKLISSSDKSNSPGKLLYEVNELRKDHNLLKSDEHSLKSLMQKINAVKKRISDYNFWMKYADSTDPLKQNEAEKRTLF